MVPSGLCWGGLPGAVFAQQFPDRHMRGSLQQFLPRRQLPAVGPGLPMEPRGLPAAKDTLHQLLVARGFLCPADPLPTPADFACI